MRAPLELPEGSLVFIVSFDPSQAAKSYLARN
jgi:hypothetical protein